MPVRQCPPRPDRVHLEARPTADEHRRLRWASRIAGESLSRFVLTGGLDRAEKVLSDHPDVERPMDLWDELDSGPFPGEF